MAEKGRNSGGATGACRCSGLRHSGRTLLMKDLQFPLSWSYLFTAARKKAEREFKSNAANQTSVREQVAVSKYKGTFPNYFPNNGYHI